MPARFRIDKSNRIVRSTVTGPLNNEDMRAHSSALAAHPDFDSSCRQLMDLRGVTRMDVTNNALTEQSKASPWKEGTQRAFVSDTDEVYGMARMFELLSGSGPHEIRVFREMSVALDWLEIDEIE